MMNFVSVLVFTVVVCLAQGSKQVVGFISPKRTSSSLFGVSQIPTTSTDSTVTSTTTTTTAAGSEHHVYNIEYSNRQQQPSSALSMAASSSEGGPIKIIIAGAPASGKGTQCETITEQYGVVHLSTGDMLRQAVADQTPVGKLAKEYMDNGKLVPDDVIIGIVKDRLAQDDCINNGWLLDGFPRTKAQADALKEAGIVADCFLFLNVPDEMLIERVVGRRSDPETGKIYHLKFSPPPQDDPALLQRLVHRSDDTEEKVKVRLQQFHDNVDSVKDSYTDILVTVDGNQAPALVSKAIDEAIQSKIVTA